MHQSGFLLLLLASQSLMAQKPADAVVLSRRIEYWNPAWSPDGKKLLFESTLNGQSSVYIINTDGTGLRHVTADTSESIQPNWSPDGRRIVFSSNRSGHTELYTMNIDGTGLTRLTTMNGGGWYQSSFSPDGKWCSRVGRTTPERETVCSSLARMVRHFANSPIQHTARRDLAGRQMAARSVSSRCRIRRRCGARWTRATCGPRRPRSAS